MTLSGTDMKRTTLIRVCADIPLYATCPYCHKFIKVDLQLFYYCDKCHKFFLPYQPYLGHIKTYGQGWPDLEE